MKKSLKAVLAAVCFIAAGAFFMGCSSPSGSSDGGSSWNGPKYAVGDIVLNDGTKVSYDVAKNYTDDSQEYKDLIVKAVAVIFKADTESTPALGVGIYHGTNLNWCKDRYINGFYVNFKDTVVTAKGKVGSYVFIGKTDGSDNFMIMARTLDNTQGKINDTGLKNSNNYALPEKDESTGSDYSTLKTNYPAFEFAYYYGKNSNNNIITGSKYETGWYLPSLSELNDIYQANKSDSIIDKALESTCGHMFSSNWYWSSSQFADDEMCACLFIFGKGEWDCKYKGDDVYLVRAIRAFN